MYWGEIWEMSDEDIPGQDDNVNSHVEFLKLHYIFKSAVVYCVASYSKTQTVGDASGKVNWMLNNMNFRLSSAHMGNGTPLQYSCLENPMDRGAW